MHVGRLTQRVDLHGPAAEGDGALEVLLLVQHEHALVDVRQRKLAARDGDGELKLAARRFELSRLDE
mgnify:CR=1 FL=1